MRRSVSGSCYLKQLNVSCTVDLRFKSSRSGAICLGSQRQGVLKGTAGLRNMTANAAGADSPEEVTPQPQEPKEQPSEVVSKSKEESEVVTHKYPGLQRLIQARPRNDDQSAFTLGLYSAAVGSDVATIALQSGVNISGSEMGLFHGALSSDFYTELKDEERMYPPGVMEDMQMEVLRRSNISMPCKKNQRVYGTVYALDRKRVFIDAGHSNLAQLNRQELFVRDIVTEPGQKIQRLHAHDIRIGDCFVFRIQELKSPLGGIWLVPEKKDAEGLRAAVWAELQKHYQTQEPVGGRILNTVSKGFSVGIAGVVGLLHWDSIAQDSVDPKLTSKFGVLQPFHVYRIDPKINELEVRFATGHKKHLNRLHSGRMRAVM